MNRRIAVALAAVLGLSSLALRPASANDLTKVLDRLGLRNGSINSTNQATIESNIQIGMSNLNSQIQQALAQGRLSAASASSLQLQMDRIASMDASFRVGGYTNSEVQQLLSEFSRMNDMVANAMANPTIGGGYYNNGNAYGRVYGYGLGNMNYSAMLQMENRVRANLATATANGSISASTAASLRAQLANLQVQLRSFGTMSTARRNSLLRQLANLDQRVTDIAGGGFYY